MYNRKYIRLVVDDKDTWVSLSKCNYCPFFRFVKGELNGNCGRCSKFENKENPEDPTLLDKLYGYCVHYDTTTASKDIPIPDWCGLSDTLVKDDIIVYQLTNEYSKELTVVTTDNYNELPLISDINLRYTKGYKLMYQKTYNSGYTAPVSRYSPSYVEKKICSCCGQDKTDVSRTVNLGMCSDCWKLYEGDTEKKKFAKINNFRLKRKSDFSEKTFKIL